MNPMQLPADQVPVLRMMPMPADANIHGDVFGGWIMAHVDITDGDYTMSQASAGRLWTSATIDTALPAGTNNIGDVDVLSIAAGDNNIGKVDIVTVPTDPLGANADAASATGTIRAKLRFIASTGIPITGTVTVGSHAVTNAGTFATQVDGAALTALQLIDNPVIVDDAAFTPATSSVMMAGFEADETATDSVDEGDAGAARMTLDRKFRYSTASFCWWFNHLQVT